MERIRRTPDFSYDTEFAKYLYDNVDWAFTRRKVPSTYEKIDTFQNRHSVLELTSEALEYVGIALESYAIDVPMALTITLRGRNPYIYEATRGSVWIEMKHKDHEETEIFTTYTVELNSASPDAVDIHKDVKRKALAHEVEKYGVETLPLEINVPDGDYKKIPVTRDERRGISALVSML